MLGRAGSGWRWVAAALAIALLALGLGSLLRARGLGEAANIAQLISLIPLLGGIIGWARARRLPYVPANEQLGLARVLRTIAEVHRMTGEELRTALPGWSGDTVDAYMSGSQVPGWDFVAAFIHVIAGDNQWRGEQLERRVRPIWEAATAPQRAQRGTKGSRPVRSLALPPNTGDWVAALQSVAGARATTARLLASIGRHQAISAGLAEMMERLSQAVTALAAERDTLLEELSARHESTRSGVAGPGLPSELDHLRSELRDTQQRLEAAERLRWDTEQRLEESERQRRLAERLKDEALLQAEMAYRRLAQLEQQPTLTTQTASPDPELTAAAHRLMGSADQETAGDILRKVDHVLHDEAVALGEISKTLGSSQAGTASPEKRPPLRVFQLGRSPRQRLALLAMLGIVIAVTTASTASGISPQGVATGPAQLLIDSQTGQLYLFCDAGALCPVVNYASARLALRSTSVQEHLVNQAFLRHYPRGPVIGIPGLPEPLPASASLIRQPWSVCARTPKPGASGAPLATLVGGISTGGLPLRENALLVRAAGHDWVVWRGLRMLVSATDLIAINAPRRPVEVPVALLNALPEGPDLAPPAIPGAGANVTGPHGPAVVGQVYRAQGDKASPQYYVMLRAGLAPVTQVQARLLEATPSARAAEKLSLSRIRHHLSADRLPSIGLPQHVPAFTHIGATTMCVNYTGTATTGTIGEGVMVGARLPQDGTPTGTTVGVSQIVLPQGAGALVGTTLGSGQAKAVLSYFLISGGRRYALASKQVAAVLGYRWSTQATKLPANVIGLIPAGPSFDPAEAAAPASLAGSG